MRIDKFLKVSRVIKRRTVANDAADNGRISVNGRVVKPSYEVKVGDVLEISYNRIYAPGDVLGFTEEDEETGEGFRVGLQLNGEILNQAVEIDFKEIADDLVEMRHINDEKELVIEIL
jgi:ribosomal 50S subunit-recycling heat shock protein